MSKIICIIFGHRYVVTGERNMSSKPFVLCQRCLSYKVVAKDAKVIR